jgi:hypothetical protein
MFLFVQKAAVGVKIHKTLSSNKKFLTIEHFQTFTEICLFLIK